MISETPHSAASTAAAKTGLEIEFAGRQGTRRNEIPRAPLATTARGTSVLRGLPAALDVASTARVMGALCPAGRESLLEWASRVDRETDGDDEQEYPCEVFHTSNSPAGSLDQALAKYARA